MNTETLTMSIDGWLEIIQQISEERREMIAALQSAARELHEANLANSTGSRMRNPDFTISAEAKVRDVLARLGK